ncbi:MAG: AraC family transcriptional regulator [Peptostreptococcaceae bacterium]
MDWIKITQSALYFIEEEISNSKLTTELIAKHVHVSESHFIRAFNVLTGFTLAEYIRNRRLCVAGELLKKENMSVFEASSNVGYESPEAFSKAFKRFHGINPRDARSSKLKEFYPLHVKLILTQERPLTWKIEEKDQFFLSGTATTVPNYDSDATNYLWSECEKNGYLHECCGFLGFETLVGVSIDYGYTIKAKCSKESDDTNCIIPASKWAIFNCSGDFPKSIIKVWSQIYESWMKNEEYEIKNLPQLEVYYEDDEGYGCEIWIAIK